MNSFFDFSFAWEILPKLLTGLLITIQATFLSFPLALVLGLGLAIARRSKQRLISYPTTFLIEFIRSTPLLVQLYFLYFVLPNIGIILSALTTGVIGFAIHYACYLSELYRAGIEAIPKGQWEAAMSTGMTWSQTFRIIILPQTVPLLVPQFGNYLIGMFKETTILSAITVQEVLLVAKTVGTESFQYLEPITTVGILFLILSVSSAIVLRWLEHQVRKLGLGDLALAR
jgi:polar amino acid transport system permease protein